VQGTRPLLAIILVKFEFFSVLGAVNPHPSTDQGQICQGPLLPILPAKFDLDRCNMSPLWGEKPQNQPVSKQNTGRAALWADPAGKQYKK